MGTYLTRLRAALVLLLVGSGLLFAIGSTIERHRHHAEHRPAVASSGESAEHSEQAPAEAGARILGVDTESVALTVVAIVCSLLLAVAVWLGRRWRLVLLCVAGFGLVFAAGDGRELVHQLDESNAGLAAIAAILIALHLAVTVIAGALLLHRRDAAEPAMA